ncbi:hypothetical protein KBX06_00380 [Micromonospora sp. C31]|uniref:hypothetical protein n=1 Tax=Micromonospora sp. C31 TaxID=2824876 RepID=UPI001B37434C|nr:hypothetical protein [Micromonospora sp. C31]MBQ1071629.1 hypothetical protein [Micromonospora sp. C31]
MLLDPEIENDVAYELCQLLGRAILPIRQTGVGADGERGEGTAFLFAGQGREHLLTADALTHAGAGVIGLRASVTEPAGVAADAVALSDLSDRWRHHADLGVADMPTVALHEHADTEGWRWRTQQVPDAIAADRDVIARIGAEPGSAVVLAHGVGAGGARPLEVAIERVARVGGAVRLLAELPTGYLGAPVFGVRAGDDGEPGLRCLGLVLPACDGGHPLATFDRIRAAVDRS